MVVPEAAKAKVVVEAIMPELESSAIAHIPGQQANGNIIPFLQALEQRCDAGQYLTIVSYEALGQVLQIGGEEAVPVIRGLSDTVQTEQIACDCPVGPASKRDIVG